MTEHEHHPKNSPEQEPAQAEVAKRAYAIYLKEGRPAGHATQNWAEAEAPLRHAGSAHGKQSEDHTHMAADFRKRF